MTDRKRNFLVGLFVFGGMLCLGVLIVLFGQSRGLFQQRYIIRARFDQITGVREGTDVNLAGIWVGNVAEVKLANLKCPGEGAFAYLEIDRHYVIPDESVAEVVTPIMGRVHINIIPPGELTEALPKDGSAIIPGKVTSPLDTVIDPKMQKTIEKTTGQIGALAKALTPAARALEELLVKRPIEEVDASIDAPEKKVANLSTAIERLDRVLKHIDTVIGDPEVHSDLKEALANFRKASEQVNRAVEALQTFGEEATRTAGRATNVLEKVDTTVVLSRDYIDRLGQKLLVNADRLGRALDYFAAAGRDVAEGEGTVGLLLRDPKFYDELMLTVRRLGEAAAELEVLVKQWQDRGLFSGK